MSSNKYDHIINLPHYVSEKRPRMPMIDRAAQFAPFAALTGYDDAVKETGRLTDDATELPEYVKANINDKLRIIMDSIVPVCVNTIYIFFVFLLMPYTSTTYSIHFNL